nr:TIGR02206 family membrane protein [Maliibacterium massiliense]
MDFFKPAAALDPSRAFPMFGAGHIALLALVALGVTLALRAVKKLPADRAWRVLCIAAVAVPVLEFSHTLWMYFCGTTQIVKLLPLHLCAMQSIFIPLAVLSKKDVFREFIYATSVLGGAFGILFPAGVADAYPLWHYQSIQTVLLHSLLIFVPLALITTGTFRPDVRRFPRVLCIFLCVALAAALVDFGFGQNYMFLNLPPEGTPLVWIYNTLGRPAYLLTTFLLLAGMSIAMYIPFWPKARGVAAQEEGAQEGRAVNRR